MQFTSTYAFCFSIKVGGVGSYKEFLPRRMDVRLLSLDNVTLKLATSLVPVTKQSRNKITKKFKTQTWEVQIYLQFTSTYAFCFSIKVGGVGSYKEFLPRRMDVRLLSLDNVTLKLATSLVPVTKLSRNKITKKFKTQHRWFLKLSIWCEQKIWTGDIKLQLGPSLEPMVTLLSWALV